MAKRIELCDECGNRIGMLHCSECYKNLCHKCLFDDKCKGCFTDSFESISGEKETWENMLPLMRL